MSQGHFRDVADEGFDDDLPSLTPSETPPRTAFNQALDAMLKAFADEAGRPEFYPLEMPRYHAARRHVEELFIASDRLTRNWMAEVETLQHIGRTTREQYEQAEAELSALRSELLKLREERLTLEETAWLLDYHLYNPDTGEAFAYPDAYKNAAVAKLRSRLSTGETT